MSLMINCKSLPHNSSLTWGLSLSHCHPRFRERATKICLSHTSRLHKIVTLSLPQLTAAAKNFHSKTNCSHEIFTAPAAASNPRPWKISEPFSHRNFHTKKMRTFYFYLYTFLWIFWGRLVNIVWANLLKDILFLILIEPTSNIFLLGRHKKIWCF